MTNEHPEREQDYRYGQWCGNIEGRPQCPRSCVFDTADDKFVGEQCSRARGHGPGGLYCKQHAKKQTD